MRERILMRITEQATAAAESKSKSEDTLTSANPGRNTTMAPRKPIAVAVQRRIRTVSERKITAPMVTNNGVVKPSATASASGTTAIAVKKATIATRVERLRSRCSPNRFVRNGSNPVRKNSGAIASKPKKLRKKTSSKGGMLSERWRIIAIVIEKTTQERNISNAAFGFTDMAPRARIL